MKIEKKYIKETFNIQGRSKPTFSSKKQNIIITEAQLELILSKLEKK
jgi:hypothetical protein